MAYDPPMDGMERTGNSGMGQGGGMMHHAGMHSEGVLHVSADMLPKGMKLNKGDIVEFKVIGDMDEEGDWPIEYNYDDYEGEEGKGEEGKEESWEEGLKNYMSPRSGGEEAPPGGSGGY